MTRRTTKFHHLGYLLTAAAVSLVACSDLEYSVINSSDNDWDVLLFTQQWPVTACFHWIEENHSHACSLPRDKIWTIHGIWPTKYGQVGPNFCNASAEFDPALLDPIKDALSHYWPSVEVGHAKENFWKHEWLKHGTCAALLTDLATEGHYFGQGLVWREKYLLTQIFETAGIHPDSINTVIALQDALKKTLDKNPSIHCVYDRQTDTSYLSEIRLCFNKSLELIDCDGVFRNHVDYPGGKVITNCHISMPIHYPSVVPPIPNKVVPPVPSTSWKFPFVNFYKLLNFVMWFTL